MTGARLDPPLDRPGFFTLLRDEPIWVRFLADCDGSVHCWLDDEPDPPLDDYERARLDRLATEELLRRQSQWREAAEDKRLDRRIARIVGRNG